MMQSQSKLASFVEACTNTLVGLMLAFAVNAALFIAVGVTATPTQNAIIVGGHTVVSVIRGYVIRRFFNAEAWYRIKAVFALCPHERLSIIQMNDGKGCTVVRCDQCLTKIRIPLEK